MRRMWLTSPGKMKISTGVTWVVPKSFLHIRRSNFPRPPLCPICLTQWTKNALPGQSPAPLLFPSKSLSSPTSYLVVTTRKAISHHLNERSIVSTINIIFPLHDTSMARRKISYRYSNIHFVCMYIYFTVYLYKYNIYIYINRKVSCSFDPKASGRHNMLFRNLPTNLGHDKRSH